MQLTDEQKQRVTEWIEAGLKLGEIQDRMAKELDLRMTYMDARLLVDDLKLTPKDPEVPQPPQPAATEDTAGAPPGDSEPVVPDDATLLDDSADALAGGAGGKVSVAIDQLARPGALVSGKVTFSDGVSAEWYLDQFGRLGMVPSQQGYRPPQADIAEFQMALDRELQKMGL